MVPWIAQHEICHNPNEEVYGTVSERSSIDRGVFTFATGGATRLNQQRSSIAAATTAASTHASAHTTDPCISQDPSVWL